MNAAKAVFMFWVQVISFSNQLIPNPGGRNKMPGFRVQWAYSVVQGEHRHGPALS